MAILAGQEKRAIKVYQSPAVYVAVFYGLLVLWTVGTAPLIWQRFAQGVFRGDWLYGVMIGFFYLYTWFWSLGIAYRISLDAEGHIELKSIRRTLVITAKEVRIDRRFAVLRGGRFCPDEAAQGERLPALQPPERRTGGDLPGDRSGKPPDQDRPGITKRANEDSAPRLVKKESLTMDMMFTIPGNTLLVIGFGIMLATIGFVIYGFIKGWKNVMPDYDKIKKELTIDS